MTASCRNNTHVGIGDVERCQCGARERPRFHPATAPGPDEEWNVTTVYVSPERYKRIVEWQQHPPYGEMPYEALFKDGDPEEPDPPTGRDIDNVAIANFARLGQRFQKNIPAGKCRLSQSADFYKSFLLIHDFRRGALVDPAPLATAIGWYPGNDPHTLRCFRQWRNSVPIQPGDPDAYTQLVTMVLLAMQRPKDGVETARDRTPQAMRRNRRWITRTKRTLVPVDLSLETYIWWFRNEVTRIVKHEILPDIDDHSSGDAPFQGHESASGDWLPSPVEQQQQQQWQDEERADPSTYNHGATTHVFDRTTERNKVTARSRMAVRKLRTLARGPSVTCSPLQRQILDVVAEDTSIQNYREIAEQLGVGRETVKNAIFDLTRKRQI